MKKATIICVDDEKIILDSLRSQLKRFFGAQCSIEVAESGQEALEIMEELEEDGDYSPSLIISDQIMPNMKGDVLLAKVKDRYPKTLCVLLTGQADLNDVISAINNAGIYRYIQKPWSEVELNTTVREALVAYKKDLELQLINKQLLELNRNLEKKVIERTVKIQTQKDKLEVLNVELNASINYAQRIQHALLPEEIELKSLFTEVFVLYRPLNKVSGDIYWSEKIGNDTFIAILDCTGHGVPGALLSVIGHELLRTIVMVEKLTDPGAILIELHSRFVTTLRQDVNEMHDGMDLSICRINKTNRTIEFSSANQRMVVSNENSTYYVSGTRQPLGGMTDIERNFETVELVYDEKSVYYMLSDGYIDQFGGERNKKLMFHRFMDLVTQSYVFPLDKQRQIFTSYLDNWKKDSSQIDDITVIGFRI